jgi:phosphate transport system substrate-binding protein
MALAAWLGPVLLAGCGPAGGPASSDRSSEGASGETGSAIVPVSGLESLSGLVTVDGSSTVFPVTEAVAEEFQEATGKRVRVTVGISGTGGGFKKFTRGEIDIADASRPILQEEIEAAAKNGIQFLELPICYDALTVVVHPSNDWADTITVEELKRIWEPAAEGKVRKWSDVRPGWPDAELVLYGPGTDSGTFDYFTEAIVGKAKASRTDFTPSEDDNTLVQGIEGNKYALGYFGYAYYEPNRHRLKALKIVPPGKSEGVAPSRQSVIEGAYVPLSRPLFIYVSSKAVQRAEVRKFAEFYVRNAGVLAAEVQYVPLPAEAYAKALARLEKLEFGTAFQGHPAVGVSITELLDRPLAR